MTKPPRKNLNPHHDKIPKNLAILSAQPIFTAKSYGVASEYYLRRNFPLPATGPTSQPHAALQQYQFTITIVFKTVVKNIPRNVNRRSSLPAYLWVPSQEGCCPRAPERRRRLAALRLEGKVAWVLVLTKSTGPALNCCSKITPPTNCPGRPALCASQYPGIRMPRSRTSPVETVCPLSVVEPWLAVMRWLPITIFASDSRKRNG